MNNRRYNKLFLPKNREEGNEKLLLGYQSDVTEILFKKDYETSFHIPIYSTGINLSSSSLIKDGATGGPFPAASDRIFQSLKNYGNTTNNGPMLSSDVNGMWFCSWLYKAPDGTQQWVDRIFNPGSFDRGSNNNALLYVPYTTHDPVFQDVPSTLTLNPGVLYRYKHFGEQNAQSLVSAFSNGTNNENYVAFDLTQWSVSSVDVSQNNLEVNVSSPATFAELYPDLTDPQRVDPKLISFNHNHDAECFITWDERLSFANEFSLSFWVRSDDWSNCPSTQLAGNFTSKGGVGVFVENLSSFPLFVIPETYYGHLLIANEKGVGITDKLTKLDLVEQFSPKFVCVDSNNDIIVCYNNDSNTISKLNHLGISLKTLKNVVNETEELLNVMCAQNNDVWVITTETIYVYDTNLILKSQTPTSSNSTMCFAFSSNPATDQFNVVKDSNSLDVKFDEQTKWSIGKTDFNLYKNDSLFYSFDAPASTLQIDPVGRIWVLHGNNDISVLNPLFATEKEKLQFKIDVGSNVSREQKYISFIQTYDRALQQFKWVSLIQYADETIVYMVDLEGNLYKTIDLDTLYRSQTIKELKQDSRYFQYLAKGDFTGYDQRRVFKKLSPFNNKQQLIIKASLRDFNETPNDFNIFSCQCSIGDWDNKSWQHVVVSYRNKQFKLFVNGNLKASLTHSGRYGLTYDQQPSWFFGTPVGHKNGFNKEIGSPSLIFNGYLQSIKAFNRCLEEDEISLLLKSNIVADDVYWNMSTPDVQYIEKIERVFKHKLPGFKSPFYKIKLSNLSITDPVVRSLIEDEIKKIVTEMNPGYVDFIEVQWL